MRTKIALAIAALIVAAPAFGQNRRSQTREVRQQPGAAAQPGAATQTRAVTQPAARTAVNDALFAAAAGDCGMSQLALSELGAQRATSPELKQFSEKMIEEHTKMNADLRQLAGQKRMGLPTAMSFGSQFCTQSLAGLSGEDFDHCYAKAQLVAHMHAVGLFEAEAKRGADPEMQAFAAKALPQIKEHLRKIKPIAKKYMTDDESENERETGGTRSTRPSK
jgi:putative membrane protein